MPTQPPKVLAEMLDESLTVIDRLWTGLPVTFAGMHFQLDGVQLTAPPVQRPRIPLWIGGNMLVPAVRRRILRWDGSCAYTGRTDAPQQITPDDVRQVLAERRRGTVSRVKRRTASPGPERPVGSMWRSAVATRWPSQQQVRRGGGAGSHPPV